MDPSALFGHLAFVHRLLPLAWLVLVGCKSAPAEHGAPTPAGPIATTSLNAPQPAEPAMPVPVPPLPPRVRTVAPTGPRTHLVVVLHGVGADADDLLPVARALSSALPGAEWLSPDGFQPFAGGGSGRQWFSLQGITEQNRAARVKVAAEDVARWIDAELQQRKLGWNQLVLVGFSQGSMLSHWLAVHRNPAAVIAFSGRFADDDATAKTTTPVLIVHGSADGVIPVASAGEARAALEARGARVTVSIHPGLAHGIDNQGLTEAREFLAREIAPGK